MLDKQTKPPESANKVMFRLILYRFSPIWPCLLRNFLHIKNQWSTNIWLSSW